MNIENIDIEHDIDKLSNLLIGYATSNFFVANKDSPYISELEKIVSYKKLTTQKNIKPQVFVSSSDIKEYYIMFINEFRRNNLSQKVKKCNFSKVYKIDNTVEGYLIGNIENSVLDLNYFILAPLIQGRGNGINFLTTVIEQAHKAYRVKKIKTNIETKFSNILSIRKTLNTIGFISDDGINYIFNLI